MAKISINFEVALEKAMEKIKKEATSRTTLDPIAKSAARRVRTRVRLGFGVKDDGGRQKKFPPLSKSYKDYRKGIARFKTRKGKNVKFNFGPPRLDAFTSASKSNMTASGQLTDAIKGRYAGIGRIKLEIKPNRRKGIDLLGRRIKNEPTNSQIVEFHRGKREFFHFTNAELEFIEREIRKAVLKKF